MSLLTDILNRYLGAGINAPAAQAQDDFDHVARHVPNDILSQGISTALGSPQTPPAGELVSQMFEASTPEQRAAMLNQLISALGPNAPSVLGGLLANAGVSGAGGMPTITPNEASRVRSEQVQDVVTQAQQRQPDILGNLGDFYAQHSGLVKTLGSAALAIALAKISARMKGR